MARITYQRKKQEKRPEKNVKKNNYAEQYILGPLKLIMAYEKQYGPLESLVA